jgi:hypothetical protein
MMFSVFLATVSAIRDLSPFLVNQYKRKVTSAVICFSIG